MAEAVRRTPVEITKADPMSYEERSPKSYGTAVSLCGVFGIFGAHHFYLGNYLHGLVDLALSVVSLVLLWNGNDVGILFLLADGLHTVVVFYQLIVEKARDGQGRRVCLATHAV